MPTRTPKLDPSTRKRPSPPPAPRLPHERDQTTETAVDPPRGMMRRALKDLEQGQEDTDLRGTQGRRVPQTVRKPKTELARARGRQSTTARKSR